MNRDGIDNFVSVTVTIHEGRPQERDLIGAPPLGMGEGGGATYPSYKNQSSTTTPLLRPDINSQGKTGMISRATNFIFLASTFLSLIGAVHGKIAYIMFDFYFDFLKFNCLFQANVARVKSVSITKVAQQSLKDWQR